MFQIKSGIKKEKIQMVGNGDILEIWLMENWMELDKFFWKVECFTWESSKMMTDMETRLTSCQMELFMMESGKMERGMEWESRSTSEENGDMKVSTKMTKDMEQESSFLKMEPFTLEDLKMAFVKDLDHSTQLMGKRSSNVVSGKKVY
jgi:hypothetical protein